MSESFIKSLFSKKVPEMWPCPMWAQLGSAGVLTWRVPSGRQGISRNRSRMAQAARRLGQLQQHLAVVQEAESSLDQQACAGRSHALPRIDVEFLEAYIDEYKDLKKEVYSKLESRRDLLVPSVESLTKGQPTLLRPCPIPATRVPDVATLPVRKPGGVQSQ